MTNKSVEVKCLNCNSDLYQDSKFCHICGDHHSETRLTSKEVFKDLFEVILIWNANFFRTFFTLLLYPSRVISYYLKGGRKRFMNPLLFLLFSFFLVILIFSFTNWELLNITNEGYVHITFEPNVEYQDVLTNDLDDAEYRLRSITNRSSKIMYFLFLPIMALTSKWVFRSRGLNYAEHFIINAYLMGQITLLLLALLPLSFLFGSEDLNSVVPLLIVFASSLFYHNSTFSGKKVHSILRSLLFVLLNFLWASTLIVLLLVILGLIIT